MKFEVNFYNEEHKTKLLAHSHAHKIQKLVDEGLEVSDLGFLTYCVFREQRNYIGWRNYAELKDQVSNRIRTFSSYFDTSAGSLRARFPSRDFDISQTESAGVAGALLVMNKIYDLHEADWQKIPIGTLRDLDFELASDGNEFIQVEAKGTVFNEGQNPPVSHQKASIEAKKEVQRQIQPGNTSFFGVITEIPSHPTVNSKCLLLDPPESDIREDPKKYQLLARLQFYANYLRTVSRSNIITALMNRIQTIFLSKELNYLAFNKIPLLNIYSEQIETPPASTYYKTVLNEKIAGNVFPISNTEFFFSGIDLDVYRLIVKQDFEEIRKYKSKLTAPPDSVKLLARLDMNDLKRFDISVENLKKIPGTNEVHIFLSGKINISLSGRIIGFFQR